MTKELRQERGPLEGMAQPGHADAPMPLAGRPALAGARLGLAPAAGLTFLAWLLLGWPVLSGGRVIPWDAMSQFYAYLRFLAASWHSGQSAFWNPYQYAGMPSVADPQSLIFSPVMAAIAWLLPEPGPAALAWGELLHLLAGGMALLLLFRLRGWRLEGGLVAALIFMFGGVASGRLQHAGLIMSYGLVPVALTALIWTLGRPRLAKAPLLGVAIGLLIAGRDQVALLGLFVLAGYGLACLAERQSRAIILGRGLPTLLAAALTALAVAIVPVLLTLEFVALSNRPEIGFAKAAAGSLSPVNLFTLWMPNYFRGLEPDGLTWGPGIRSWSDFDLTDRSTNYLFAGVLPLVLIIGHGLVGRRLFERDIRFFAVLLAIALLYSFGRFTPFFQLSYDLIPFVSLFRRPADAAFIVNLGFAVTAGWLAHRLIQDGPPEMRRGRTLALLAGALAASLGVGIAASQGQFVPTLKTLALALAWTAAAGLVLLLAARPEHRGRSAAALVLLLLAELWTFNSGSVLNARNGREYRALVKPASEPVLQALQRRVAAFDAQGQGPARIEIIGLGGPWQNAAISAGLENTMGYNPLQIEEYSAASGAQQNSHTSKRRFTALFPTYDSRFAKLLGLRLVATSADIQTIDRRLKPDRARLVEQIGPVRIYELDAYPRAMLLPGLMATDPERLLIGGRWPVADPLTAAVVDQVPAKWAKLTRARDLAITAPKVTITERRTTLVRLAVETPRRQLLVLNDPWYPGWRVRVDGVERELVRANIAFRGVVVPPGRHEVVFSFEPLALANLQRLAARFILGSDDAATRR